MKRIGKIIGFIATGLLLMSPAYAQDALTDFEKTLTPSPVVSALGNFGGVDVKKNTGGLQKSIPIFQVKTGALSYNPTLDYFSTGVRVDEWGSRTGIGWAENTTAIITRIVKHLPDEKATSRIGDLGTEFSDDDFTHNDYLQVKDLAEPLSLTDGDYDIFNFNIFGASGQFFIRNGTAVLLSYNNNFKIEIVTDFPTYNFILTDTKGTKYHFTTFIETTRFNADNPCDNNNPNTTSTATAWFIDKMVSPGNDVIEFDYDEVEYTYIYDFNDYYIYAHTHNAIGICEDLPASGTHNYCLRRKTTKTKRLNNISGANFTVNFDYINRNDFYYEKLLSKITLHNNNRIIKEVKLNYKEVVATSTFEDIIASSLQNDPWENNALKTRYYLDTLKIGNGNGVYNEVYSFGYLNPEALPHRYSLSQDFMGCYNGKANTGFVPREALIGMSQHIQAAAVAVPYANRNPTISGVAGMLNGITYPTGGRDSIIYEQNHFRTVKKTEHKKSFWDFYGNDGSTTSYTGGFFTMEVPHTGPVDLKIDCYYDSEGPEPGPEEEYYAVVELHESGNKMIFPNGRDNIELRLNQSFHSTSGIGQNQIKLMMETGKQYDLYVNIFGNHTTLRATLTYIDSVSYDPLDSAYLGYRVAKVITSSGAGPDLVKSYNYNSFNINNGQMTLSDASSLHIAPVREYNSTSLYICMEILTGAVPAIPLYKFSSKSNYDFNVFGGLPYSYGKITEFLDNNKTSFIASEFEVQRNDHARRLLTDHYPGIGLVNPEMDNSAWGNGLEVNRYTGYKSNSSYLLSDHKKWSYSVTSNFYYMYNAYLLMPVLTLTTSPRTNLGWYILKDGRLYRHWVKLDTLTQVDYFRNGSGYHTVMNRTHYRYNSADKLVEEEETTDSKGLTLLKQIFRPHKMVASSQDPLGIYQGMIGKNIISPEVDVISKRGGSQIGRVSTSFHQPFTGLFVPDSVKTQKDTASPWAIRLRYLKYDNMGNVLSYSRDGGPVSNIIWSYKGMYPVAKIDNIDYTTIENTLMTPLNNFRALNPTGNDTDGYLSSVKSAYPGAFITRYTYIPHVGMTEILDPRGIITYYNYDDFQRLKSIEDQDLNLLRSYEYHYKP